MLDRVVYNVGTSADYAVIMSSGSPGLYNFVTGVWDPAPDCVANLASFVTPTLPLGVGCGISYIDVPVGLANEGEKFNVSFYEQAGGLPDLAADIPAGVTHHVVSVCPQVVRDSMTLDTVAAIEAGSIDAQLASIRVDTEAIKDGLPVNGGGPGSTAQEIRDALALALTDGTEIQTGSVDECLTTLKDAVTNISIEFSCDNMQTIASTILTTGMCDAKSKRCQVCEIPVDSLLGMVQMVQNYQPRVASDGCTYADIPDPCCSGSIIGSIKLSEAQETGQIVRYQSCNLPATPDPVSPGCQSCCG